VLLEPAVEVRRRLALDGAARGREVSHRVAPLSRCAGVAPAPSAIVGTTTDSARTVSRRSVATRWRSREQCMNTIEPIIVPGF
jgi:hypothetical protein